MDQTYTPTLIRNYVDFEATSNETKDTYYITLFQGNIGSKPKYFWWIILLIFSLIKSCKTSQTKQAYNQLSEVCSKVNSKTINNIVQWSNFHIVRINQKSQNTSNKNSLFMLYY